jgi:hypothetical protein
MQTEKRIFGPPGTGKTYDLANRSVPEAVSKYGKENVLITSFTRTAAKEVAARIKDLPDKNIGTLHSFCYHGLGQPKLAHTMLRNWNEQYPTLQINGFSDGKDPDTAVKTTSATNNLGETLYNELQILRAKMIDKSQWPVKVLAFEEKWTKFKQENGVLDYTDLIEEAKKTMPYPPFNASVIFVDEAQDFTNLELSLLRSWKMNMQELVLVGDDDQCHPAETMISTEFGDVPIKDLNPFYDKIKSFEGKKKSISNKGYEFRKTARPYNDIMFEIFTKTGKSCKSTFNHLWPVFFSKRKKINSDYAIAIVQTEDNKFYLNYGIMFGQSGTFSLLNKMKKAGVKKAWIITTVPSKSLAVKEVHRLSELHSFPCSTPGIKSLMIKTEQPSFDKVVSILKKYNKYYEYPIIGGKDGLKHARGYNLVRSCNLIENVMSVRCVYSNTYLPFEEIVSISKRKEQTVVYSLEVEPFHTYVADGIITHNCIFGFSGATPEAFLNPPIPEKDIKILDTSFRVPEKIHSFALGLLDKISYRQPKHYFPKKGNFKGEIKNIEATINSPEKIVDMMWDFASKGETSMLITSCGYMLSNTKNFLKSKCIPFHNPYRPQRKDWNPVSMAGDGDEISAAELLYTFLSEGKDSPYWDVHQFVTWAKFLMVGKDGLIRGQGKKAIEMLQSAIEQRADGLETTRFLLDQVLSSDAIDMALKRDTKWLYDNLLKKRKDSIWYVLDLYNKYGTKILEETPKIIIGTIHSVKGGESDNVFVAPDLSLEAYNGYASSIREKDNLMRLYYVAVTRAKKRLFLLQPGNKRTCFKY